MAGGEVLRVFARARLDWSDPSHWAETKAPCRCCDTPTCGRDSQDRPVHMWCVEAELLSERVGRAREVQIALAEGWTNEDERALPGEDGVR